VLFDIDLEVRPGEIVALLGTNGAGKSTLVRTIAGLVEPRRGSVRLGGRELTDVPAEERRRGGLVYVEGGAGAFRGLTVHDNLRLFARHAANGHRDGLEDVLDVFPALRRKSRQVAGSLSRGEQQMLALAKGVMSRADLIVVDEMSLGLSPAAIEQVHEVIRALNASGRAVLFVEQSVKLARAIAERCYFLDAGRVVFEGPVDAVDPSLLRSVWIEPEAAHA
jgi:ABC-type branched-subunit amino acid transport system ATPase component